MLCHYEMRQSLRDVRLGSCLLGERTATGQRQPAGGGGGDMRCMRAKFYLNYLLERVGWHSVPAVCRSSLHSSEPRQTRLRFRSEDERLDLGLAQGESRLCSVVHTPPRRSRSSPRPQERAADLGQRTNYAVAAGLDYTVEKTKVALAAAGVAEASEATLTLADKARLPRARGRGTRKLTLLPRPTVPRLWPPPAWCRSPAQPCKPPARRWRRPARLRRRAG
jgi:hypothetical protein